MHKWACSSQNSKRVTVCVSSVTLTNFQASRRGRKIGSVWLRPFKSCTNNLHSPAVRALPLCSEGREKKSERCCRVRLRKVWKDTVWGAGSMFTQTHQIWLLTAGVIHFCPTRPAGRKSPQLLPISSRSTGTPTSPTASLLQIPLSQLQRGTALPLWSEQRKLEPEERS